MAHVLLQSTSGGQQHKDKGLTSVLFPALRIYPTNDASQPQVRHDYKMSVDISEYGITDRSVPGLVSTLYANQVH